MRQPNYIRDFWFLLLIVGCWIVLGFMKIDDWWWSLKQKWK